MRARREDHGAVLRPTGHWPVSSRFDQSGGRVVISKKDERSCPRHAASINLGFVHGLDRQSVTT